MKQPNKVRPLHNTPAALEQAKMEQQLLSKTRGLYSAMGVKKFITAKIVDVQYWNS